MEDPFNFIALFLFLSYPLVELLSTKRKDGVVTYTKVKDTIHMQSDNFYGALIFYKPTLKLVDILKVI